MLSKLYEACQDVFYQILLLMPFSSLSRLLRTEKAIGTILSSSPRSRFWQLLWQRDISSRIPSLELSELRYWYLATLRSLYSSKKPLDRALKYGYEQYIENYFRAGLKSEYSDHKNALSLACQRGYISLFRYLMREHAIRDEHFLAAGHNDNGDLIRVMLEEEAKCRPVLQGSSFDPAVLPPGPVLRVQHIPWEKVILPISSTSRTEPFLDIVFTREAKAGIAVLFTQCGNHEIARLIYNSA